MRVSLELKEKNKIIASTRQHSLTLWRGDPAAREKGLFSSELFLMGLGSCMMGTMLNFAANEGYAIRHVHFSLEGQETQSPSQIAKINVTAEIEGDLLPEEIARLKRVATHCKIHNTLKKTPEVIFNISVNEDLSSQSHHNNNDNDNHIGDSGLGPGSQPR